jgi:hypothetical protein
MLVLLEDNGKSRELSVKSRVGKRNVDGKQCDYGFGEEKYEWPAQVRPPKFSGGLAIGARKIED